MNEIEALQGVIHKVHGVKSEHVASVPISEKQGKKTVWEGDVEVFELEGHATATQCYGWAYQDGDGKTLYTTVLQQHPVRTALDAVRAALATQPTKKRRRKT